MILPEKCARLDLNQRLSASEADTLSPELRAHCQFFITEMTQTLKINSIHRLRQAKKISSVFSLNAALTSPTKYNEPVIQIASDGFAFFTV